MGLTGDCCASFSSICARADTSPFPETDVAGALAVLGFCVDTAKMLARLSCGSLFLGIMDDARLENDDDSEDSSAAVVL